MLLWKETVIFHWQVSNYKVKIKAKSREFICLCCMYTVNITWKLGKIIYAKEHSTQHVAKWSEKWWFKNYIILNFILIILKHWYLTDIKYVLIWSYVFSLSDKETYTKQSTPEFAYKYCFCLFCLC